eukprot:CAMPEP_0177310502 /NCGR_PEP_ID=MMETSP0368-20130122/9868_1 /TAXON_ID=447022 ORGANISM="Scrippsiella hangoei-like, Strain SHHI-4" /NCGR_SAMPLE_ID=MMETSP0368 /ASSEMBLY_ACC=CAM_ASM_000363 /LENGTH=170 /DNA_ID=CAMNT_0018769455 /DNA_START=412 /DNA_END=922 /DNA_ORIENTATION=+
MTMPAAALVSLPKFKDFTLEAIASSTTRCMASTSSSLKAALGACEPILDPTGPLEVAREAQCCSSTSLKRSSGLLLQVALNFDHETERETPKLFQSALHQPPGWCPCAQRHNLLLADKFDPLQGRGGNKYAGEILVPPCACPTWQCLLGVLGNPSMPPCAAPKVRQWLRG